VGEPLNDMPPRAATNTVETDLIYSRIESHVRSFFIGHEITEWLWQRGRIEKVLHRFRVLRVAPGSKSRLWIYISLGAWEVTSVSPPGLEFMIFASQESPRHIELLAMTVNYHSKHTLGLGHTFPVGEPWLEGSQCDHMLVSLPYPFGRDLELCKVNGSHIHLFWLLPITSAERQFKSDNGLEALEELFENQTLEYWRVDRDSVV
jgi:hypothetical protein